MVDWGPNTDTAETKAEFHCQRCGRCCREGGNTVEICAEDFQRWLASEGIVYNNQGQPISPLSYVRPASTEAVSGVVWFDSNDKQLPLCPYYVTAEDGLSGCLLHTTGLKANICRDFPFDWPGNIYEEMQDCCFQLLCPEVRRLRTLHGHS